MPIEKASRSFRARSAFDTFAPRRDIVTMNRLFLLSATLFACLVASPTSQAQPWSRFRGDNGSGLSSGPTIPSQWTDTDYAWKINLPGVGHSSPVLWNKRLFVTCGDEASATRALLCIDADRGSVLWTRQFPGKTHRKHADNAYAAATPAADDTHVFVCWTTPESYWLVALTHDGKDAWSIDLGPFVSQHGHGASPIVVGDLVILTNDQEGPTSFILAADRKTGQIRWKTPRRSSSMAASTPCVYQTENSSQIIVTSRNEGVAALDPASGKVLWQLDDVLDRRVIASPVLAGNIVLANCGEGGAGRSLVAVTIPSSPDQRPKVAWRIGAGAPYVPTPLAKGNRIFTLTDNGTLACLDRATGQTIWQQRIGGQYYASPICIDDRIYCVSKKGEVSVHAAADTYRLMGKTDLGELCYATPAVANGRMYLRTFTKLMCLGK